MNLSVGFLVDSTESCINSALISVVECILNGSLRSMDSVVVSGLGFMTYLTVDSTVASVVDSGLDIVVDSGLGFVVHSGLGFVVDSTLGFVVDSALGFVVDSALGFVVDSVLGFVVDSALGFVVDSVNFTFDSVDSVTPKGKH